MTRTQTRPPAEDARDEYESTHTIPELEVYSDDEIESMLFQEEEAPRKGFMNLPTAAGLSLIVVGIVYLLQEMGLWNGVNMTALVSMLPVLAGVLIILLGFGVLSWDPKRRRLRRRERRAQARAQKVASKQATVSNRKRLTRSRTNKKVAGVCAGISEYMNIDPTVVRIAFVIGAIASQGAVLLAYIIMAMIIPKEDFATAAAKERIIIH